MNSAPNSDVLGNESAGPIVFSLENLKGLKPPPGLELLQPPPGLGFPPCAPPPGLAPPGQLLEDMCAPPIKRMKPKSDRVKPPRAINKGLQKLPVKICSDAIADADGTESEDTGIGSEVCYDFSRRSSTVSGGSSDLIADAVTLLSKSDDLIKASRASLSLLQKASGVTSSLPHVPTQPGPPGVLLTPATTKLSAKASSFAPSQYKMPLPVGPLPVPVVPMPFVPMAAVRAAWQNHESCQKQAGRPGRYLQWLSENHPEFVGSK